jgi:hypothetical protein
MTLTEPSRSTHYISNPDFSCREEGPDGALLFNPDTDQVLVVNVTGLLIWQALAEPATRAEVIEAVEAQCTNVPDEVAEDVNAFIDEMIAKGFVGALEG